MLFDLFLDLAEGRRDEGAYLLERYGDQDRKRVYQEAASDEINLDRHASFLGGWSILGEGVKKERYVQLDPGLLKAAADLVPASRALEARARREVEHTEEVLAGIEPGGGLTPEDAAEGEE